MPARRLRIGTAAWSIPGPLRSRFAEEGSLLQRYARQLDAVEINSSFYRSHQPKTYERWAASTPAGFRFSAKLPRTITHDLRLKDADAALSAFEAEVSHLGEKLGPILIQLPPSLAFEPTVAERFFAGFRTLIPGLAVCEPRHESWFAADADDLLESFSVARAAADPAPDPTAARPGGYKALAYWRWHGSPRIYYSDYSIDTLESLDKMAKAGAAEETWCIFDNTASGAATENALTLQKMQSSAE